MQIKKLLYIVLLIVNCNSASGASRTLIRALNNYLNKYYNNKSTYAVIPAVISPPKCGTHLVIDLFSKLTGIRNHTGPVGWCLLDDQTIQKVISKKLLLKTHVIYNNHNIKCLSKDTIRKVLIIRDPRDQIVSAAYWIKKRPQDWPIHCKWTISELIDELITGGGSIWSTVFLSRADEVWQNLDGITSFYNLYLPWQFEPGVYTTQFEKLVGPRGGGNLQVQLHEIMNIAQHIGLQITEQKAQIIAKHLFGNTLTFREGKIGSWKDHFPNDKKEKFKKKAGQLLIDLGYEKNLNW